MSKLNLKFRDFVTFQRGFDLPSQLRADGEIPIIASTGISGYHNESKVKAPGVVTGRSGSLGSVQYINEDFWPLNTALWVKDFKGNEPKYVYYYLQTMKLEQYNSGAGVPTLNRNDLDAVSVFPHKIEGQKKIAFLLSSYDHLIENNSRRIAILEEIAQRLYREWFVHFHFPGHENVEMVDSEIGMTPEGWHVSDVESCCSIIRRGISPKYNDDATGIVINQKCIRDFSINLQLARNQEKAFPADLQVKNGDVLINSTGVGTLGRVAQMYEFVPNCTIDSHVTLLRPDENIVYYVGSYLREKQDAIMDMGVGSTGQTELNRDKIKSLQLVIPDREIVSKYEKYIGDLMSFKFKLQKKNVTLRETRDHLLPRLISGDIDASRIKYPSKEVE